MSGATRVLVVEDEEPIRMALVDALVHEGYQVLEAADGDRGLELALRDAPDIVLLDLMLPGRDGFSVLRALRQDRLQSVVIVLSARGEEWDRVQGFEYGADDYVVKPFSMRELLGRMRALLRRAEGSAPGLEGDARRVRIGAATVDFAAYCVERNGAREGLSRREMELLRHFLAHEGEALERIDILDAVWGRDEDPSTRTIDMHVLKLRRKIEPDPERPRFLLTVHGKGYRFSRRGEGDAG
ncbi:MAG: response regulator transcription factor [Planctomycetota bacterium]|nr:MAG: response regulator transcription factor [Planctomycetota bacterium]